MLNSSLKRLVVLGATSALFAAPTVMAQSMDAYFPVVNTPTISGNVFTDIATDISATYTDTAPTGQTAGISNCSLLVNGANQGSLNLGGAITNGSATGTFTFGSSGTHDVRVRCTDLSGNVRESSALSVNVASDTSSPTLQPFVYVPGNVTVGTAANIQVGYADASPASGVANCRLAVDGGASTAMNLSSQNGSSGTASLSHTFNTSGNHSLVVTCTDRAGRTVSRTQTLNVSASGSGGAQPVISSLGPINALLGHSTLVTANFSGSADIIGCNLYVNGALVGSMNRTGTTTGSTNFPYTFNTSGNQNVEVRCVDASGNTGTASGTVNVQASTNVNPAYLRQLLKLQCPPGFTAADHPCKAVYYVDSLGRRHAFPNEKVYFTWYPSFGTVVMVDNATMASIPLGANVVYRPGSMLVKFESLPRTYAVTRNGMLRWVANESLASSLYGTNWRTRVHDISDAFYANYQFGNDINSSSAYDVNAEMNAVTNIDSNLSM